MLKSTKSSERAEASVSDSVELRKVVRLYRFYNVALSRHGEPFALCDYHAAEEDRNPPPAIKDGSIFRQKIADKAVASCQKCEYGS